MRIKTLVGISENSDQGLHLLNLRFLLKDMDVLVPPREMFKTNSQTLLHPSTNQKSKIQKSLEETQSYYLTV